MIEPVMLYNYPKDINPFYMRVSAHNNAMAAMRHVIGDDVAHPMARAVNARDSTAVQSDVGMGHVLTHLGLSERVVSVR